MCEDDNSTLWCCPRSDWLLSDPADGERLEAVREDSAGDYLAGINCICGVGVSPITTQIRFSLPGLIVRGCLHRTEGSRETSRAGRWAEGGVPRISLAQMQPRDVSTRT